MIMLLIGIGIGVAIDRFLVPKIIDKIKGMM
jgi:hypothetical protein